MSRKSYVHVVESKIEHAMYNTRLTILFCRDEDRKFWDESESVDANNMLSEVLVIEKENAIMKSNFTLKNDVFWDMSDEEIFNDSQDVENSERFLKPLQQKDLDNLKRKAFSLSSRFGVNITPVARGVRGVRTNPPLKTNKHY